MSRSLKEQLVEAGIITEDKIRELEGKHKNTAYQKPTEQNNNREEHRRTRYPHTEDELNTNIPKQDDSRYSAHQRKTQHETTGEPNHSGNVSERSKYKLAEIYKQQRLKIPMRGHRRWYYEAKNGRIFFLSISQECEELLTNGMAAIVDLPSMGHKLISSQGAQRIADIDPSCVLFWNANTVTQG